MDFINFSEGSGLDFLACGDSLFYTHAAGALAGVQYEQIHLLTSLFLSTLITITGKI